MGDVVAVTLVGIGLVAVALAWRSIAATDFVPKQLAYLVSGGFTGIALVGTGVGVAVIQRTRHSRSIERHALTAIDPGALRARATREDR